MRLQCISLYGLPAKNVVFITVPMCDLERHVNTSYFSANFSCQQNLESL